MLRASAGPIRGALLTKSTFFAFVVDLGWILALQTVSGALFGRPLAPKGTPGELQGSIWGRQSAPLRVANSNFMVFLSQEAVQGAILTYFGSILVDFWVTFGSILNDF